MNLLQHVHNQNKDDNKQIKEDNKFEVLFSLADMTNHGLVWPEPLLSKKFKSQ